MKIQCEAGHLYDDTLGKNCPYCRGKLPKEKHEEKNGQKFNPQDNMMPVVYGPPPWMERQEEKNRQKFNPQDNIMPDVYGSPHRSGYRIRRIAKLAAISFAVVAVAAVGVFVYFLLK